MVVHGNSGSTALIYADLKQCVFKYADDDLNKNNLVL